MAKTIICCIDTFHDDPALLQYGISVSRNLGADLELFDVQLTARSLPRYADLNRPDAKTRDKSMVFKESEEKIKIICDQVRKEWADTDYKLIKDVMYGKMPRKEDYLLDEMADLQPEVMIMRVRHEGNLLNEIFGVVETEVAEKAICPVLLIPEKTTDFLPLKRQGYLVERETPIERVTAEVRFLTDMVLSNDVELNIYYRTEATGEAADLECSVMRTRIVDAIQVHSINIINWSKKSARGILEEITLPSSMDIFAFQYRPNTFPETLLKKDISKKIILEAEVPLLVF